MINDRVNYILYLKQAVYLCSMELFSFSVPPTAEEIDLAQQKISRFDTSQHPAIAAQRYDLLAWAALHLSLERDRYILNNPEIAERLDSLSVLALAALSDCQEDGFK